MLSNKELNQQFALSEGWKNIPTAFSELREAKYDNANWRARWGARQLNYGKFDNFETISSIMTPQ